MSMEKNFEKYYNLIPFARGILMAILIVFGESVPLVQLTVLIFVNGILCFILFSGSVKFDTPQRARKTKITESLFIVIKVLLSLLLVRRKSKTYYQVIGWVTVGIVGITFLNELYFILYGNFTKLKVNFKGLKEWWIQSKKIMELGKAEMERQKQNQQQQQPGDIGAQRSLNTSHEVKTEEDENMSPVNKEIFQRPFPKKNQNNINLSKNVESLPTEEQEILSPMQRKESQRLFRKNMRSDLNTSQEVSSRGSEENENKLFKEEKSASENSP